jgi:hypothetical protein
MLYRIDLVFSYWIFVWYLLYVLHIVKYNPKFAIIIGIIENIVMFLTMIYFGSSYETLFNFIIINIFIKFIPYYTLIQTSIAYNDIKVTILLFLIYSIWVYINRESVIEYQNKIFDSLIHNKNQTPLMFLIQKIKTDFNAFRFRHLEYNFDK